MCSMADKPRCSSLGSWGNGDTAASWPATLTRRATSWTARPGPIPGPPWRSKAKIPFKVGTSSPACPAVRAPPSPGTPWPLANKPRWATRCWALRCFATCAASGRSKPQGEVSTPGRVAGGCGAQFGGALAARRRQPAPVLRRERRPAACARCPHRAGVVRLPAVDAVAPAGRADTTRARGTPSGGRPLVHGRPAGAPG